MNSETEDPAQAPGQHAFKADVARLLHLMVHSVYSDKDIFLRELISNAADACEKLRFEAIANPDLAGADSEPLITIDLDADAKTIAVSDNGIGMDRDDLVGALGTIASSGTRAFLDRLAGQKSDEAEKEDREVEGGGDSDARLIGQFGIGFYSAFMVADRVDVTTRKAGSAEAWLWSSDGGGAYTIAPAPEANAPARGTRVVLHLKDSASSYCDKWTIERLVREHSGAISVPVELRAGSSDQSERLVDGSALWTKPKSEITSEDYTEFYRSFAHQFDEPALTAHWRAEGRIEYTALAFIPGSRPLDLFDPARKGKAKLYVRRVLISDDCDLLPGWLRFARVLVDTADLPLNVSREMIQQTPAFTAIKRAVTNRLVQELTKAAEKTPDVFAKIWENFGAVLKEGLYEDAERRDSLFKMARFATSAAKGLRTLSDYMADIRPNQTAIYYLVGEDAKRIAVSPQLEGFRARGIEVLLLSDPVDAFWVETAVGYDGKPFKSATRSDLDLSLIPLLDEAGSNADGQSSAEVAALIQRMKETIGADLADVRASSRLSESPACLVAPESGPDLRLRRLLAEHGKLDSESRRIMEVNPSHPLVVALSHRLGDPGSTEFVEDAIWLLYDEARMMDGENPADAGAFARRMFRVLQKAAS
ncbi:MAG: molecular chaperone HtpG [Hyphomicrobiales bacterium]|nr:molecular chaperone HtpG [Hyphomicrobiales bacterium]